MDERIKRTTNTVVPEFENKRKTARERKRWWVPMLFLSLTWLPNSMDCPLSVSAHLYGFLIFSMFTCTQISLSLSVSLPVSVSVILCLAVCLSDCLSVCVSAYLSIHLSIYLSIYLLSIYLSLYDSISLSLFNFIYLSL